jgi:hypothetical protein
MLISYICNMKHSERLLAFHNFGLNIEAAGYDTLVDELIIRYKKLLAEKVERDKGDFQAYLHNIKTTGRN